MADANGNKTGGRKKGTPNKTTALLKDAILMAAREAGGGGDNGIAAYLQQQATENPGPFMSLLGKVLPHTLETGPEGITINLPRGSDKV